MSSAEAGKFHDESFNFFQRRQNYLKIFSVFKTCCFITKHHFKPPSSIIPYIIHIIIGEQNAIIERRSLRLPISSDKPNNSREMACERNHGAGKLISVDEKKNNMRSKRYILWKRILHKESMNHWLSHRWHDGARTCCIQDRESSSEDLLER